METHMDSSKLFYVCKKICRSWNWTSNGGLCTKGTRIIVGWDTDLVDLMVLSQTDQVMHTQVTFKVDQKSLFCSFIYVDNYYKRRRELWHDLCIHKVFVHDRPWVILGDFNSSLNLDDNLLGSSTINIGMRDFREHVKEIEVLDINSSGLHFTWNQKPKKGIGIFKKVDRVMGNLRFIDEFPSATALFQPYRISDHSPCVVKLPSVTRTRPKPFKFNNILVHKQGYIEAVEREWTEEVSGHYMFRVVKKLKSLKTLLRKLLLKQGNLHTRVDNLRRELDMVQSAIEKDAMDQLLRDKEATLLNEFKEPQLDEKNFLKQKAKMEWLEVGDANSAFFHKNLKCKNHRSKIEVIKDMNGVTHEGGDVQEALVDHYIHFLGMEHTTTLNPSPELVAKRLDQGKASNMIKRITDEEIKQAMFSIGENKVPGPDGYISAFFKSARDVVGREVCLAVHEFFRNGKIL
uniref:uncharacterized protein LOC122587779 n=1 Tax=Erigeron canadensis TaxID=72917 RepID=UPI001CB9BE33|nr:uncharacterized protein LOC122587779 [Erigeron canadensis]